MTRIDRIVDHVLHDPWTSRIFLAFTVGMFLSCSAEFAAGQETTMRHAPRGEAVTSAAQIVYVVNGTVR